MNFLDKLLAASRQHNSLLCVGLDPEQERLPAVLRDLPLEQAIIRFCHAIIEATTPYVCAFKPNSAFFEVLGLRGMYVFQEVIRAIPAHIPVIIDAKRGDLGNTARNYAATVFDIYGCDAVTVNPYLGYDSVAPFLAYRDKGVILLCRTSNPSARDFQDLRIPGDDDQERYLSTGTCYHSHYLSYHAHSYSRRRCPGWRSSSLCPRRCRCPWRASDSCSFTLDPVCWQWQRFCKHGRG